MTRYLYRVVDRNERDYHYDDNGRCSNVLYATAHTAYVVMDRASRSKYALGPFRILRVPVTAWEEVK